LTASYIFEHPAIATAAQRVAEAELAAQEGTAKHREIENELAQIRVRIAAFEAKRHEIGARRAQGELRDSDGADLALLATDAEALSEILARREANAAAARTQAEQAVRNLQQARHALQRVEDEITEQLLVEHAEELGSTLSRCIDEMRAVRNRLGGGRLGWVPSRKLAGDLSVLDNGRPW
jgi:hypothetical protein